MKGTYVPTYLFALYLRTFGFLGKNPDQSVDDIHDDKWPGTFQSAILQFLTDKPHKQAIGQQKTSLLEGPVCGLNPDS